MFFEIRRHYRSYTNKYSYGDDKKKHDNNANDSLMKMTIIVCIYLNVIYVIIIFLLINESATFKNIEL